MARNIAPLDITWFLDLNSRGLLDLKPPYQRHSVWTLKERRYFLDTIFNGYPCPPLFLYKSLTDDGVATYHVVDGKQRLETVINFANNKISLSDDMQDEGLAGKKWKGIGTEQRKKFWNYQIAVEMLDSVDNAVVKEIFDRYNRTSRNLERQELRHAKYDGWFVKFAEEEAKKSEWKRLGIVTTANARRMRDVQFISELMIVILKSDISGFDQNELDEYYANYETPLEFDPEFQEDEFIQRFENVKSWIIDLEDKSGVVSELAKTYTHFYSLWSSVALNNGHTKLADDIIQIYRPFMVNVAKLSKTDDLDKLLAEDEANALKQPYIYYQSARGANTELPQRKQRHETISSLLFGEVDAL